MNKIIIVFVALLFVVQLTIAVPNFYVQEVYTESAGSVNSIDVDIFDFKGSIIAVLGKAGNNVKIEALAKSYGGKAIPDTNTVEDSVVVFDYSFVGNEMKLSVKQKATTTVPSNELGESGRPQDYTGVYEREPVTDTYFPKAAPVPIDSGSNQQPSSASKTTGFTVTYIITVFIFGLLLLVGAQSSSSNQINGKFAIYVAIIALFSPLLIHQLLAYEKDNVYVEILIIIPQNLTLNSIKLRTSAGSIKVSPHISNSRTCQAGDETSSTCCSGKGYLTSMGCACNVGFKGTDCQTQATPPSPFVDSVGYGIWNPLHEGECTKEEHDSYYVIGPDGVRYATWHPIVHEREDGTLCSFGHEHGIDPRLFKHWFRLKDHFSHPDYTDFAGIPFAYGNEAIIRYPSPDYPNGFHRHEDHVGHKIMWRHDIIQDAGHSNGYYCDGLIKVHQGTHSPDAFLNPLHEVHYFARCFTRQNETERCPANLPDSMAILTIMVQFGDIAEIFNTPPCRNDQTSGWQNWEDPVQVDTMLFPSTPTYQGPGTDKASREVPTRMCIDRTMWIPITGPGSDQWSPSLFYEIWQGGESLNIKKPNGNKLVHLGGVNFGVLNPGRFYDPSKTTTRGNHYFTDLCQLTPPEGKKIRGGFCGLILDSLTEEKPHLDWDDPESPQKGDKRDTYFRPPFIYNQSNTTIWYTDVYGFKAASTPDIEAGRVIKQYVSTGTVEYEPCRAGVNFIEPTAEHLDNQCDVYGGWGCHLPN